VVCLSKGVFEHVFNVSILLSYYLR